jgi:hypothetical protein
MINTQDLQDEIFRVQWIPARGSDREVQIGRLHALNYCIKKRLEGFTLSDFMDDFESCSKEFRNPNFDYEKGYMAGLRFNLIKMEELENERLREVKGSSI